jgi:PTH1 family peptidyl-tRNA hydrolase
LEEPGDGIRVVVGLGNPGARYAGTRHNIGFRLLERLAGDLGAGPEADEGAYAVSWADWNGERIALVRPLLYMNRSGDALARFPESAVAGPGEHLIVFDDVSLPFGTLRFREEGSAGGHRGLLSVLDRFGTEAVPRLRLGVGREEDAGELADYVLAPFTDEEEERVEEWLARASRGVQVFLQEGPEAAMTRFNGPALG